MIESLSVLKINLHQMSQAIRHIEEQPSKVTNDIIENMSKGYVVKLVITKLA